MLQIVVVNVFGFRLNIDVLALKIKKDLEFDSKIRFLLCRRYVFSSENASNQVSNTDYFGDTQVERLLKGQPPLGGF